MSVKNRIWWVRRCSGTTASRRSNSARSSAESPISSAIRATSPSPSSRGVTNTSYEGRLVTTIRPLRSRITPRVAGRVSVLVMFSRAIAE
jgi:hypothetical protein